MGTKSYLLQVRDLDEKIDSKLRERECIRRSLRDEIPTEESRLIFQQYDEEVNDYIDSLLVLQVEISDAVMKLNNFNHQMVLRERYLHNKKWEEIAEDNYYSLRRVHDLHNEALEEIGRFLKK